MVRGADGDLDFWPCRFPLTAAHGCSCSCIKIAAVARWDVTHNGLLASIYEVFCKYPCVKESGILECKDFRELMLHNRN